MSDIREQLIDAALGLFQHLSTREEAARFLEQAVPGIIGTRPA